MFNRITLVCIAVASLCSGVFAGDVYWTGAYGRSWSEGGNWDTGSAPSFYDTVFLIVTPGPIVDSSISSYCGSISIDGAMDIIGGSIYSYNGWIRVGDNASANAIFTISDGTFTSDQSIYIGYNGTGTINMTGGTLTTGNVLGIAYNSAAATGQINLIGGRINCQNLSMANSGGTASMDIAGGTLIINGDKRSLVNGYISSGWITAYGGSGNVVVDYGVTNSGKTTLKAVGTPDAKNPIPANNALNVLPNVQLTWTAGFGAVSHNVYFGTTSPGTFQGNQTTTTFNPGQLALNGVYYWRIDEVDGSATVTTGQVWTFRVTSGKAANPDPANGAIDVPLNKILHWAPGSESHDVYFGATNPPAFIGNQSSASYNPGPLCCTTYYWRIDEKNANGTITGDIWSFTTSSPTWVNRYWTNGSGDRLWSNAGNWSNSVIPSGAEVAEITNSAIDGPIISAPTVVAAHWIRVGGSGDPNMTMNGGTLNVGDWLMIGTEGVGMFGTFTMNGGTINLGVSYPYYPWLPYFYVAYGADGTLVMNGGTINVPGEFCIGYRYYGSPPGPGGSAVIHLNGGTIKTVDFYMTSSCSIDITDGMLIINGNYTSTINGYISGGLITAFNGEGVVLIDYNISNPGKTTVKGYLDARKAANPTPNNNAEDVPLDANLSWTAGSGAASHNIYLGTSNPPSFIGNQTEAVFEPGGLAYDTTYYWRVDEIVGPNTVTGRVWTFTTVSGKAINPSPAVGAMNIAMDKVFHWTAGPGIASHDVYFGTDMSAVSAAGRLASDLDGNNQIDYNDLFILASYWLQDPSGSEPYAGVNHDNVVDFTDYAVLAGNWMAKGSSLFKGNTTSATYDPDPNLAFCAKYYWRVDEVNGPEMRKGKVWSFTTPVIDSNYTLVGKVMCGYQGWFNTPGSSGDYWAHWSRGWDYFGPDNCTVDMWPDMTEMGADEKYEATNFYDGITHYYVFTSHNRNTVLRHFQWMQNYGIDGVYLQRFATEVNPGTQTFYNRNDVLSYCKEGANTYGRKYAVMYDLSGLGEGETSKVIADWKYLVDTMKVTQDPCDHAYIRHNNKPVVAIWGLAFDGRAYTAQECFDLVNFLKNDPIYGGNVVMIGVNDTWLSRRSDVEQQTWLLADIISPWLVGRYGNIIDLTSWASGRGVNDRIWCTNNGKDYLPAIFPGFSWHNLNGGTLNQIARNGGQFLWDQVNATISTVQANMLYVAMFDEVDEGTAIFKISNNPPMPGGNKMFVTFDMDPGFPALPSDEYLWLVGQTARTLRGEIPLTSTRPIR